ncbi:hypothetical protein CGH19_22635 [Vibrio parahaemolyticus]|nr:hypothetical protein CGH19_22635 [Vibrio parahaemolyticus]
MIGDKALYQSLARELIVSAPDGAVKVIMIASLVVSAEGDVGTFETVLEHGSLLVQTLIHDG